MARRCDVRQATSILYLCLPRVPSVPLFPLTQHATPFGGILCMGLSPSGWMPRVMSAEGIFGTTRCRRRPTRPRRVASSLTRLEEEPETAVGIDWFLCWLFMQINGQRGDGGIG